MVSSYVCTVGFPSRRYPPPPSNPLSGCRTWCERWQWRAEGLRMEPPPCLLPGSWDVFQSPIALSAKNKCLTLYLTLFGFSVQELVLVIHFPARLQSSSTLTSFSPGKYFYNAVISPFLSTLSSVSLSEEGIFFSLQKILVTSLCPFGRISATAEDVPKPCPRCNVLVSGLPVL